MSPEQRRVHRVEHILRRDGGSPDSALEGLAAIVEDETWRKVPADADGAAQFASFREFVTSPFGLRYSTEQLQALLRLRHSGEGNAEMRGRMEQMRAGVARLLRSEQQPLSAHGEVGRGRERVDAINSNSSTGGTSADYLTARLKRDNPALAEQVVRGELTPNAAAQLAGIRKPRILVTSPESVAVALRRHMTPADLARLAELLAEGAP